MSDDGASAIEEVLSCEDLVLYDFREWGRTRELRVRWAPGPSPVVRRHLRRLDVFFLKTATVCDQGPPAADVALAVVARDLSASAGTAARVALSPDVADEWKALSFTSAVSFGTLYGDYDHWLREQDLLRKVPFGTMTLEFGPGRVAFVVERLGPDGPAVDRYEGTWRALPPNPPKPERFPRERRSSGELEIQRLPPRE
jgi:hypothetical protein